MKPGRVRISLKQHGFTLVELLVATSVLTVLIFLVAQLLNSATTITTLGEKRMEADAQARTALDRMALDFSRIVKRPDVDYFLKSPTQTQKGNDQLAFYSEVPGYYPSDNFQSPVSLVSYRVNAGNSELERMGKGLLWNGARSGNVSMVYLPFTIDETWAAATNQSPDTTYEVMGPEVFRFEYGYLLKGRDLPDGRQLPAITSVTPWDDRLDHTQIESLRDVAAIIVCIAAIDPKGRALVGNLLAPLAGEMDDFSGGQTPGQLESEWQHTIDSCALPRPAKSSIRIYRRVYPL